MKSYQFSLARRFVGPVLEKAEVCPSGAGLMLCWVLKSASVCIVIFLTAFEFSAFAVTHYCSNTAPLCPAGKRDLLLPRNNFVPGSGFEIICVCIPTGQTPEQVAQQCPSDSTKEERNVSMAAGSYKIKCGNARTYIDEGPSNFAGDWWTLGPYLYPDATPFIADEVDYAKPLRMCWADSEIPGIPARLKIMKSKLTDLRNCDLSHYPSNYAAFRLHATCPFNTDGDEACKKILREMIDGRVTFRPHQSMKYIRRGGDKDTYCCEATDPTGQCKAHHFRENSSWGDNPKWACSVPLYNRSTEQLTGDEVTLYTKTRGGLFGPIHDFFNMQCLADNIKTQNWCKCNDPSSDDPNSHYEFLTGSGDSCYCTDSSGNRVLKNKDGTCPPVDPAACPQGEPDPNESDVSKKCVCHYSCTNNPDKKFTWRIPLGTVSSPGSCPGKTFADIADLDSDPNVCPSVTAGQCPYEWSPTPHPYVTSRTAPTTSPCECPAGYVEEGGFCVRPHTCETTTDTQDCASGTEETDYGACAKTSSFINISFGTGGCIGCRNPLVQITGNNHEGQIICPGPERLEPADANGNCPYGFRPHTVEQVRGPCTTTLSINDPLRHNESSWTCTHTGDKKKLEMNGAVVRCNCMIEEIAQTVYSCTQGEPSSQDSQCRCKTSVDTETCPTGYSKSASSVTTKTCTASASPCPIGWTLDGDGSTCTASPSTRYAKRGEATIAYYTGDYDRVTLQCPDDAGVNWRGTARHPNVPSTQGVAKVAGWRCGTWQDHHLAGLRIHGCKCVKPPVKECPGGIGTYNSDPNGDSDTSDERCETACTPEQVVSDCKCVKDEGTRTCSCRTGETTAPGGKCTIVCPPQSSTQKICTCAKSSVHPDTILYIPTEKQDVEFPPDPENQIYKEIREGDDPSATPPVFKVCGPLTTCCHECVRYKPCSVSAPDGVCPEDPKCELCPDGRPVDADGKCDNEGPFIGGNTKGVDIAFDSSHPGSIYSVYSTGSASRPDYICWRKDSTGQQSNVVRDNKGLFCPPPEECGESCPCQLFDTQNQNQNEYVPVEDSFCEYASRDPMRFEDGIVRGGLPSSGRKTDKYGTDIRFFRQTTITAP